jgi:hypothetical protein
MRDHVSAHDTATGNTVVVPARWVDNSAIFGGRYSSSSRANASQTSRRRGNNTSRDEREPVGTQAADGAADETEPGTAEATTTEE